MKKFKGLAAHWNRAASGAIQAPYPLVKSTVHIRLQSRLLHKVWIHPVLKKTILKILQTKENTLTVNFRNNLTNFRFGQENLNVKIEFK